MLSQPKHCNKKEQVRELLNPLKDVFNCDDVKEQILCTDEIKYIRVKGTWYTRYTKVIFIIVAF